jgi:hypothetical protein
MKSTNPNPRNPLSKIFYRKHSKWLHTPTLILLSAAFSWAIARPLSLSLGEMSMAKMGGAAPLTQRGIRMSGFKMKVGGVAFASIAVPGREDLELLGVRYNGNAEDGQRLEVQIADAGAQAWVPFAAYDWELIPCARFVSDPDDNEACFTLFGEMTDPEVQKTLESENRRILNYHPAFEDTLLGLRLFQADIMLLTESAADLPKITGAVPGPDGQPPSADGYILGAGEAPPLLEENVNGFQAVRSWLGELQTSFSSYVICDERQDVLFDLDGDGSLILTGTPQWYCWTFSPAYESAKELAIEAIRETAILKAVLQSNLTEGEADDPAKQEALLKLAAKFFEEDVTEESIEEIVSDTVTEDEKTIDLIALSDSLTGQIEGYGGINPAVHSALTKTMHLSALFRATKAKNAESYATFVGSLTEVTPSPTVDTPDNVEIPEEAAQRIMLDDLRKELESEIGDDTGGGAAPESPAPQKEN